MESEQERFTHTMDLLELEVAGLEQHEDLALVDRVSKLVGEIAGRITDAENKCESACVVLTGRLVLAAKAAVLTVQVTVVMELAMVLSVGFGIVGGADGRDGHDIVWSFFHSARRQGALPAVWGRMPAL